MKPIPKVRTSQKELTVIFFFWKIITLKRWNSGTWVFFPKHMQGCTAWTTWNQVVKVVLPTLNILNKQWWMLTFFSLQFPNLIWVWVCQIRADFALWTCLLQELDWDYHNFILHRKNRWSDSSRWDSKKQIRKTPNPFPIPQTSSCCNRL